MCVGAVFFGDRNLLQTIAEIRQKALPRNLFCWLVLLYFFKFFGFVRLLRRIPHNRRLILSLHRLRQGINLEFRFGRLGRQVRRQRIVQQARLVRRQLLAGRAFPAEDCRSRLRCVRQVLQVPRNLLLLGCGGACRRFIHKKLLGLVALDVRFHVALLELADYNFGF